MPFALRIALLSLAVVACARPPPPAATASELRSISISAVTGSIPLGHSQVISAFGVYADGSRRDLTTQLKWISSDSNLLTVTANSDGRVEVRAENKGVALVQAFLGNDSAAIPLHIVSGT